MREQLLFKVTLTHDESLFVPTTIYINIIFTPFQTSKNRCYLIFSKLDPIFFSYFLTD